MEHQDAVGHASEALQLSASDLNPNMEDVMKVINDLDEDFAASTEASQNDSRVDADGAEDHLTSVQDVSQIVDKATLARQKILELGSRQVDIERRYQQISRRLNLMRCRHLGNFIVDEISNIRSYCQSVAPPPPPPVPKINPFALNVIHPPINMPDGIVLPSVPSTEVLMPTSSTSSRGNCSVKVKVEVDEAPPVMTSQEKEKADEALGQAGSHLKHLIQTYDSEATESSSGGDSCDEMDNFPSENSHYVPIKKRAKWTWLTNRANIASKWTWLTAQISDLEYRIRQQTEFYRQIRAAKGAVALGEPVVSWPPHAKKPVQGPIRADQDVPLSCKPVTKDYSRVDSSGRKIIIKEPSSPAPMETTSADDSDVDDNSLGACRTRPVKLIRRRRILSTSGLYRNSARAAKECSVRCDCIHPNFWCAICFGRTNHTQVPDPVTQERGHCMSLLDHSYHQVLSMKQDIPLHLQMMQKLKNRSWMTQSTQSLNQSIKEASGGSSLKKKVKKPKKDVGEEDEDFSKSGKKKKSNYIKKRDKDGKLKKVRPLKAGGKRRKSLSVHHHSDDRGSAMLDLSSDCDTISGADGSSPIPSPSVPANNQAWAEHIRRKRETAFDIDNIVIPYSIASATRVEKLKYKEILTPTWRKVKEDEDEKEESQPDSEDIGEVVYEIRHAKAELEEQKRWQQPLWKTSGGQRSRSRRQDSCRTEASSGCNTPDPLSPGMVDRVDMLEVTTRPSTPVNVSTEDISSVSAGSIRYRRRTSSVTKPRDRNPSEDTQSSRCTSPTMEQQQQQFQRHVLEMLPFEHRSFPLSEEEHKSMLEDMPNNHEFPPLLINGDEIMATPLDAEESSSTVVKIDSHFRAEPSPQVTSAFSPSSSAEEDNEEDPDWNGEMEDPEDPEWNDEDGPTTHGSHPKLGNHKSSGGGGAGGSRRDLTLKIPKHS